MDYEDTLAELEEESQLQLEADQAAEYLRKHPEFFLKHPDLLADLHLPHETGKAVSLVEKQVSILRQRQIAIRSQLNKLMSAAKENDKLFSLTKNLILKLLSANSLNALESILQQDLIQEFGTDEVALVLFNDTLQSADFNGRLISLNEASETIGSLLEAKQSVRGIMRPKELSYLFPNSVKAVESAAIISIKSEENIIGLLAIGSYDQQRYHNNMGTMFLDFVGEVINIMIPKLLASTL